MYKLAEIAAGLRPLPVFDGECTRITDSGCLACVEACPVDVMTIGPRLHPPVVDLEACVSCGLCQSACPTQAISNVGPKASQLVQAGASRAASSLRCSQAAASGADLICFAAMHVETIAACALALAPGGTLQIERSCAECPMPAANRIDSLLNDAADILAGSGKDVRIIVTDVAPGQGSQRASVVTSATMSRRSLFGRLQTKQPAPPGSSPRELLTIYAPDAAMPTLHIDDSCIDCGACHAVCPTGALTTDARAISVEPQRCVACGECVRVCQPEAITIGLRAHQPDRVQLRALKDKTDCTSCNRPLPPGETSPCSSCLARTAIGASIWDVLG